MVRTGLVLVSLSLAGCSESERLDDTAADEATASTETGPTADMMTEPVLECGDGALALDELCDDGNDDDADGCSNDCVPRECPLTWMREASGPFQSGILPSTAFQPLAGLPDGAVVVDMLSTRDLRVQAWSADGDPAWEFLDAGPYAEEPHVFADPHGTVFVSARRNEANDAALVVAIVDGTELWRVELDHAVWSLLQTDPEQVVVMAHESWLAFDVETGAQVGSSPIGPVTPTVAEPGTQRLFGTDLVVTGNDYAAQIVRWDSLMAEPTVFAPLIGQRLLVFDADGRLWGLGQVAPAYPAQMFEYDPDDGAAIQEFDIRRLGVGPEVGVLMEGTTSSDGLVIAGTRDAFGPGYVVALDRDMQIDCVAQFESQPDGLAVAVDGGFYVTANHNHARLVTRFR